MTTFRHWIALCVVSLITACSFVPPAPNTGADIIVVGDSILAWHRGSGRSIPDIVEDSTGLRVSNVAVSGARFIDLTGPIPSQYVAGDWDWVIVDGGGNDLLPVCGTTNENQVLNALISADGKQGAFPSFMAQATQQGAQVIVLGYYPISDQGGPFVPCRAALDELAARQERMAAANPSVIFVDSGRVIGAGDVAAYAPDRVHPSPRGAALVGQLIASTIRDNTR